MATLARVTTRTSNPKGWRSGFEETTAAALATAGVPFVYEGMIVSYVKPASKHKYTPDFALPNGVVIETKGLWTLQDRQKIVLVRKQNPTLDLRMLFQNPKTKISKGSPTTYADFCDRNGIPWAKGPNPPAEWLKPKE